MVQPFKLPKGKGIVPSSIRELAKAIGKIEPLTSAGLRTNTHPSGTNRLPLYPMLRPKGSGSGSIPRYR